MKNILFTLILLIAFYISNAQIVNIPDANFKAYLVNNGQINTNNDTEIQVSEAIAFTGAIYASNNNISDLTGIEEFTSLTGLACGNNQLTNLDLSANTALTFLGCNDNMLTSLNFSTTLLTDLDCKNNLLTSLDVSNNPNLAALRCQNNQLTSLNVANTAITVLYCADNLLNTLDVSTNTALTTLDSQNNQLTSLYTSGSTNLEYIYCSNNQITSIDVSTNTLLRLLRCSYNQLTQLNVKNGNNTNFTVNGFMATYNPNLTCIEVDDVAWSTANWTNIDAQTNFSTNCNYTQITYVPDDNFENYLENNGMGNGIANDDYVATYNIDTVSILNISGLNITDLTGIQDFTALTELSCNNNQLTTIDVSANTALTELNCGYNSLTNLDVSANTALSILSFDYNQITSIDLSSNTVLTEVLCIYNSLSTLNLTASPLLTRVVCYNNQLTNLSLPANSNLEILNCRENQLTSLDVSVNTGLSILFCQSNQLTQLNVKNGNNTNITGFAATGNPDLTCIEVDDATWSAANWINIDATSTFVNNQAACDALASVSENNLENQISIFPNPATNSIHIQNNGNLIINKLSLYNSLGKRIYQSNHFQENLDLSTFSNGIYILKLSGNNQAITKKVSISK